MNEGKKLEEVREIISGEKEEFKETRKIIEDKKQFSLRIPKSFIHKLELSKNDSFVFVLNPREETIERLKGRKSHIIAYLVKEDEKED